MGFNSAFEGLIEYFKFIIIRKERSGNPITKSEAVLAVTVS
jgi:hypothetical protein